MLLYVFRVKINTVIR